MIGRKVKGNGLKIKPGHDDFAVYVCNTCSKYVANLGTVRRGRNDSRGRKVGEKLSPKRTTSGRRQIA